MYKKMKKNHHCEVNFQKSIIGSPIVKFLFTVHGKLKSLAMMNLKILLTFMLCVALEKKRVAFIAFAYALACTKLYKLSHS